MKLLGLDIGDKWTGVAISDALGWFARPLKTVATQDLNSFLLQTITEENVESVVVGLPKTLRGTESEQTKKTRTYAQELEKAFPTLTWVLWDERLTSKQAAKLKKIKTKEDKLQSHAVAAALILGSYLDHKHFLEQEA